MVSNELQELDHALHHVVAALAAGYAADRWDSLHYKSRWTPAGDVGSDDFWKIVDGQKIKASPSNLNDYFAVSNAAKHHLNLSEQLGHPRWYMMTVKLSRNGKYTVDFEYRDDYEEGDIMKPLD